MEKSSKWIIGSLLITLILISIFFSIFLIRENQRYSEFTGKITDLSSEVNRIKNNLNPSEINKDNLSNTQDKSNLSNITLNSMNSVVMVITDTSIGSGFFISKDLVVTSTHVILEGDASQIYIKMSDGGTYHALKSGDDSYADISLLKIENASYTPLKLGNSDSISLGDKVTAIGNPFGLEFSITEGIISGVREEKNGIKKYIQTTAALNPGNSGGPLLNANGEVIGVVNMKVLGGDNLGFALESNYVKEVVNKITMERLGYALL